jgi:transglutaminase-like putative cysteine protease
MTRTDAYIPPLLAVTVLAFVPHIAHLPLWVTLWCAAAWIAMLMVVRNHLRRPSKTLRQVLTLGGIAAVLLLNGLSIDRNAGIAMLWILAGVKPMEIDSSRDAIVAVFLAYFLAVAALFYADSLVVGCYVILTVLCVTAVLVWINQPQGSRRRALGLAARLAWQAAPVALILFILFPRVQGGLWGLAHPANAVSGFSERLMPGSVSRLVLNNDIVFRAEFDGPLPEPALRYWRGVTFWHTDGRAWTRMAGNYPLSHPVRGSKTVEYTMTLEPHGRKWLFALDLPLQSDPGTDLRFDHTLAGRREVTQRKRYRVRSAVEYDTGPLWQWELAALNIPVDTNPETLAMAGRWREQAQSSEDVVEAALEYLRAHSFRYTLNPPLLGDDAIDDFLFETRKGYCEHFAAAFAFLMRAANVPARIVGGYLGGDVNPYGQYLIVRQSHAHTWVEVWLAGRGWVRIDPTLTAAPARAAQGVAAALPPEERPALLVFDRWKSLQIAWQHLVFGWDALDNQWNKWVLGYSHVKQRDLLSNLGIDMRDWKGRAQSIMIGAMLIGLLAVFSVWRSRRTPSRKPDAVRQTYLTFCDKLARSGCVREPSQGPLAYYDRIRASRTDLENRVYEIIQLYIRLRYMPDPAAHDLREFRRRVKAFNPGKDPGPA